MPAMRFFAMLNAARRIYATRRIEDCDIAWIGNSTPEWHKFVSTKFYNALNYNTEVANMDKPEPKKQAAPQDDSSVRDFLFRSFSRMKGERPNG